MRRGGADAAVLAIVMKFKGLAGLLATAAIVACAAAAAGAAAPRGLEAGDDLAAAGRLARERGVPILLAFTQASCGYCTIAKRDYLIPMHEDEKLRHRVLIREVDIDRPGTMRDFTGRAVSRAAFAQRYRVSRVPTVIVVDHAGEALAEPVVGLLIADFYRLHLEHAIEEGLARLRAARRAG